MSRYIDADALIADMQERYCKPCKERKEDYNEVRCRACWVDDAMDEIDGFADNSIDIVCCRECRRVREDGGHANCGGYLYCKKWKTLVDEDCFCSWGERRG